MSEYPDIKPNYVKPEMLAEDWKPYKRDPETHVRYWAIPGTEGFMHRLGGLEKDNVTSAISTDPANHQRMTDLRQAKIDYIANCIPALEVKGNPDADLLVVGWGGTYGHLFSAVDELNHEGKKVALAHFNYINPLPANTAEVLKRYKKVVVCEQNNGQFATQLCGKIPGLVVNRFNRVQGQPFMVSELKEHFIKLMEE